MVFRSCVEPKSFSPADLVGSLSGVNSFIWETSLSIMELFRLVPFDFPSTVILIYPSSFISALTSVLMERLLKLNISLLYFENLHKAYLTYTSCLRIHRVLEFRVDAWWSCPSKVYDRIVSLAPTGHKSRNLVSFQFHFEVISMLSERLHTIVPQYEWLWCLFTLSSGQFCSNHL